MKRVHRALAIVLACGLAVPAFCARAGDGPPAGEGENPAAAKNPASNWSFEINPYLWLASIDTDTTLPTTPSSVSHFDTRISAAAMIEAQARYKSVGLMMDFAWLQLDSESLNPGPAFSAVDLRSDFIHWTTALTYRFPPAGDFHTEVLAGARLWNVHEEMTLHGGALPGYQTSGNKTWADPVFGGTLSYDLNERWFLSGSGMVGGFGVSSKFMADVFAGAGYRFNDWCSMKFGYRFLYEQYERNGFALKMDVNGFLLGFGFRF